MHDPARKFQTYMVHDVLVHDNRTQNRRDEIDPEDVALVLSHIQQASHVSSNDEGSADDCVFAGYQHLFPERALTEMDSLVASGEEQSGMEVELMEIPPGADSHI